MPQEQEYDKVSPKEENDGDMESAEDTDEVASFVISNNRSTAGVWKSVLIALVAFVAGILIGSLALRASQMASATTTTATTCPQQEAVSYGFLQTTRGMELLESLQDELRANGPKVALQKLQALLDTDEQVASSCHPLTHRLGRTALEELGFEGALDGMVGTDDAHLMRLCNAAYMHGIIENYLAHSDSLQGDVQHIDSEMCVHLENVEQGAWECHHGIGHGVIQNYRRSKQLETLQSAIQACKKTTFAQTCENGLWMDYFASTRVSGMLEPESLLVCPQLATFSFSCTIYAPTEYLLHYPRAYEQAVVFCNTGLANYTSLANICVGGVGMQAAKENMQDFAPVERACLSAPNEQQQRECFAQGLYYYTMTTGKSTIPTSVCEHLTTYKPLCLQYGK